MSERSVQTTWLKGSFCLSKKVFQHWSLVNPCIFFSLIIWTQRKKKKWTFTIRYFFIFQITAKLLKRTILDMYILQIIWIMWQRYLWVEIKSLQCVDNQGVLRQPIVHDHVKAIQERRSLNDGFVIRIIKTLKPKEHTHTHTNRLNSYRRILNEKTDWQREEQHFNREGAERYRETTHRH